MRREDLTELHYITPLANLRSIFKHGILSHKLSAELRHESVAMGEIQDRRAKVLVPRGRPLHHYVNLYICGRNPMLFKRKDRHMELTVLGVSVDVLDLPDVVVTDSNASSDYCRFAAAPNGLMIVDRSLTFLEDWRDSNPIEYLRKKSAKCAEVLVPECIPPKYIARAYTSCDEVANRLTADKLGIELVIDAHLFFQ